MISQTLNFAKFATKVSEEDYFGIIHAAELEATEAERLYLKSCKEAGADLNAIKTYADVLKKLINFLRYGLLPSNLESYQYTLFKYICDRVSANDSTSSRCEDAHNNI